MKMVDALWTGVVELFLKPHNDCKIIVHNSAQAHLAESAIEDLAKRASIKRETVTVKLIPEEKQRQYPVGTVLCSCND